MDLFIGNTSIQAHQFLYRLPEREKIREILVPSGQQVRLSVETEAMAHAIVEQHREFGLVSVDEVEKHPLFSGLIYSFKDPISEEAMNVGFSRRNDLLSDRGLQIRRAAAVTAAKSIEGAAERDGLRSSNVEVELVEQQKGPADNDPKLNQTIVVGEPGTKARSQRNQ